MKILLVDDELQIRQSVKLLIDWEDHGYEFLCADNGLTACELMKQHTINVLLLDINMPVMNGFEVLDWIKKENYICKVLILTCHDEFEYAQKALKYNCYDYMLKNSISSENILSLITEIKEELLADTNERREFKRLQQVASKKDYSETQEYLNYWLTNSQDREDNIEDYLISKQILPSYNYKFILISINILEYEKVILRYATNDIVRFEFIFEGIIKELFKEHTYFYLKTKDGSYTIFIATHKSNSLKETFSTLKELTTKIHHDLLNILQIKTNIFYTFPFTSFIQAKFYYRQMNLLSTQYYFGNHSPIYCVDDFTFNPSLQQSLLLKLCKDLHMPLDMHHYGAFELVIDQFILHINEEKIYIPWNDFIKSIQQTISIFYHTTLNKELLFSPSEQFNSLQSFKEELSNLLTPFCTTELNENKKYIIKKAILFIQQNYHENIYLETIAEHININSSYLSRVFSQEMGTSITNYISNYRIDIAKQLIETTTLKFYEIAEKTGFSSPIIFSTVFKKITGHTPGDHRKNHL